MTIKPLFPILAAAGALALAPPALAAPPSNDAFESPAALGDAPSSTTGTLDQATTQPGEPAHGTQTVWYAFRPAVSHRVALEIPERSGTDPVLSVYTGSTLAGLQRVGTTRHYEPRIAFDAVAGQVYRVAVGAQYQSSGTQFTLRSRVAPLPANDAFDDAARITVPRVYSGNLADATTELGERTRHGRSVWYRFKPTRPTGRVTLEVSGHGSMWLYSGRRLSSLHPLKSGSTIRFTPRRGTAYRLAVGSKWDPGFGDFTLDVSNNSIKGKGVKLEVGDGQTLGDLREHGLRGIVSARRKTTVDVGLEVSRSTARRLGLRSRVLGHTGGVVDYNEALPAVIRLTRQARRALAGEKSLHATVVLELRGATVKDRFIRVPVSL